MIEPSVEFGYRDLEVVQRLRRQYIEPGFTGKPDDLRLPLELEKLRKATDATPRPNRELDRVGQLLGQRDCKTAAEILKRMKTLSGPFHN